MYFYLKGEFMFESVFKLKERKTDVKTEVIAGLTTFLAMAYILAVNPAILGDAGMDTQGVFMATAVASAIACLFMGIVANYPVALAPGMGVNAFFSYTIVLKMGYSYQAALAATLISGLIFLLISITGIRKIILNAIPLQLKRAISAGIGFFVASIGLKNAGIIIADSATAVTLGNLSDPAVLLALFGIIITIVFVIMNVPAAVFVGMAVTAVTGLVMGFVGFGGMPSLPVGNFINTSFAIPYFGAFVGGFQELTADMLSFAVVIFSLLFVDFFDTAGTLLGVCGSCGLLNEKGELEDVEKALLADAVGTVAGAALGTSTVTSFVESTSGVGVGGRTGLTACTTGILFLLSVFISPVVLSLATNAVTAPALIVVGIMMSVNLKDINWDDFAYTASAFVTVAAMTLTASISNGMAFGFITYSIGMIASKRAKDVSPIIWALDVVFVIYFMFA